MQKTEKHCKNQCFCYHKTTKISPKTGPKTQKSASGPGHLRNRKKRCCKPKNWGQKVEKHGFFSLFACRFWTGAFTNRCLPYCFLQCFLKASVTTYQKQEVLAEKCPPPPGKPVTFYECHPEDHAPAPSVRADFLFWEATPKSPKKRCRSNGWFLSTNLLKTTVMDSMDSMTLGSVADSFAQHWDRALWWFRHHAGAGNFPAASVEMAGCAAINACEKCSEWIFSLRILSVSCVQLIFSCFSSAVLTRPSYLPMSQSHCKVQLRLTLLSRIVWGSQGEPKQPEDTQVSVSLVWDPFSCPSLGVSPISATILPLYLIFAWPFLIGCVNLRSVVALMQWMYLFVTTLDVWFLVPQCAVTGFAALGSWGPEFLEDTSGLPSFAYGSGGWADLHFFSHLELTVLNPVW